MPLEAGTSSLMSKIRNMLWNREVKSYLFFGVLTTAVNFAVYFSSRLILPWTVANAFAWLIAVEFAYLTNRTIVFRSKGHPLRQRLHFYAARLITLGLEYVVLFGMTVGIGLDDRIAKLIAGVVVVISNYLMSKLIVFRSGKPVHPPSDERY